MFGFTAQEGFTMTITVQQFAYPNTDLQHNDYAGPQEEVQKASRQSQTEGSRYLLLKKNFGKRVALLEAVETLEAYEEAIADMNCFDDQQRATRKDALCAMDELLDLIGDTLVLDWVAN